jgi:transposase
MGISRNTVKKYVEEYQEALKRLETEKGKGIDLEEIIEEMVQAPVYKRENPYKPKMTQAIEKHIEDKLAENEKRRQLGIHKQLFSMKEIHEILVENGHDIGYTSVRNYIIKKKDKAKEAFIRQEYAPGEMAEFDWGEIKLFLAGKRRKVQVAVFASGHSNDLYGELFYRQNTESFLQAHADYIEYFGGSPHQFVYDNMKVAVKKFAGSEKEPTEALLKMAMYYGFEFRFCNVRRGNEKGRVEKGVGVIETKVFSRQLEFETLEEAQAFLNQRLRVINQDKQDKLAQDRAALGKQRPKMELGIMKTCKVDKYSTISIDTNHYSVPDHYAQRAVTAKLYPKKIIVYDIKTNKKVARHERLYTRGEWKMEINHYLKTLKRKPGAIANSVALDQAQIQIKNIYETYFTRKPKELIELLVFMDKENVTVEEITDAIDTLERKYHREITADKIQLMCSKQTPMVIKESPIEDISRRQLKQISEMFL